jgi:hypothetical protein
MERPNHPAISHRVHPAWNNPSKYLLLISGEGRKPQHRAGSSKTNVETYPFAALWTTVDTGHGNIDVEINCPIIDETKL